MHIYYLLNITKGTQSSMIFFDPVTIKKNVKKKTHTKRKKNFSSLWLGLNIQQG